MSQFYTPSPRVALTEANIGLPPSNMAGSEATMPSSANLPLGGGRRAYRLENGTYDMHKQQCQTSPHGFCALHKADILLNTFCSVSLSIPPATPCRRHQFHSDWTAKEPRTGKNQRVWPGRGRAGNLAVWLTLETIPCAPKCFYLSLYAPQVHREKLRV